MIKFVTVSPTGSDKTHSFNRESIMIGCQNSPVANLILPGEILDQHVQIVHQSSENQSQYVIINLARDPFVTLNGLSFGKQPLRHGDLIQIGETTLRFEIEEAKEVQATPITPIAKKNRDKFLPEDIEALFQQVEALVTPTTTENMAELDSKILPTESPSQSHSNHEIIEDELVSVADDEKNVQPADKSEETTLENEPQATKNELVKAPSPQQPQDTTSLSINPLDSTLLEVKIENDHHLPKSLVAPIQQTKSNSEIKSTKKLQHSRKIKPSLKDYYLSEYDEKKEEVTKPLREHPPQKSTSQKTKFLSGHFKLIGFGIGILALLMGFTYLWISRQSDQEQIQASRGVADVAMALTYAQIKHIHPQNQNWSDPEFIKNTLTPVLAPEYASQAEFDRHGQFVNSPYILRIYTSSNLSQFLVIAQPAPTLLQWIFPKETIIIDSLAMEVRKIKDLKALNRLLVTADTVEGSHAAEITALVKLGELIPLNTLADNKATLGYSPPKALALIHPNTENLVYNAPRYYLMGQNLIKKALELVEKAPSKHEISMFQQELATLTSFPNLILYSIEGIQHALQSQKALSILAPDEKFLMAYLQITPNGKISNSHLLMEGSTPESTSDISDSFVSKTGLAYQTALATPFNAMLEEPQSLVEQLGIDRLDPLYLRLSALVNTRQQALKPISDEMIALLNKQTESPMPKFIAKFSKLQLQYMNANKEQRLNTALDLGVIARDTTYLPASRFIEYVKATELEAALKDYLTSLKQHSSANRIPASEIEANLKQLESSANWQELEQMSVQLAALLNFENVPDVENLVAYQNSARIQVIQKLNHFLLNPESPLPTEAFMPEYRQLLMTILETAWIIDPDTYKFYLDEFEQHAAPHRLIK